MKSALVLGALLIAAVLSASPAFAQQKMKKTAKPPLTTQKAVLDQWNDVGRKLIAMAEDFPEDKYDFKPTPAQQTFAQRLLHAANVNYFFTNVVLGQKPPSMEDANGQAYKTKADIAAYVKKSFADGAAAITQSGESGMNKLVKDPFSKENERVSDFAYGFIEHSGEIYGQLAVYYRVAGLVPPESRPKK
jgi:uncharacterized damage-inducible protein DinB